MFLADGIHHICQRYRLAVEPVGNNRVVTAQRFVSDTNSSTIQTIFVISLAFVGESTGGQSWVVQAGSVGRNVKSKQHDG